MKKTKLSFYLSKPDADYLIQQSRDRGIIYTDVLLELLGNQIQDQLDDIQKRKKLALAVLK